jgi:hypothetical protein
MTDEERASWFWELVGGGPPPAVATLGFALTSISPERGEVEGTFEAGAEFRCSRSAASCWAWVSRPR